MRIRWEYRCFTPLTTLLTTTKTTVGLPDTFTYTKIELVSCLVTPPAHAYGSRVRFIRWVSAAAFVWRGRRQSVL
jgi:hypothetical protein